MSYTPIEIVAILWGVVTAIYLGLFLIRSVVGMHEEDNLYLSAGEAKLADQQRETLKSIGKWDSMTHKMGYAALLMTVVLALTWGVSVFRELF
jgi:hypothetical protein